MGSLIFKTGVKRAYSEINPNSKSDDDRGYAFKNVKQSLNTIYLPVYWLLTPYKCLYSQPKVGVMTRFNFYYVGVKFGNHLFKKM